MNNDLEKYTKHVEGEKRGNIMVFALSGCAWCRKTKKLLDETGVEYSYIDVDLVEEEARQILTETLEEWNPAFIFPAVIINNRTCIIGVDESSLMKALEKLQIMA